MNVVTLNGLELTTCHWTYSRNNDSFLTEFIIGFQLLQIKSNNYNSYLPEKEAHSFQDPISSVCVSPYEKFCPIKILNLFSLSPTDIVYICCGNFRLYSFQTNYSPISWSMQMAAPRATICIGFGNGLIPVLPAPNVHVGSLIL